jgi:hypothetical protein
MTEEPPKSFLYEHCDVPEGQQLADWGSQRRRSSHRRAQVTGGFLAAVATLAPVLLSVRGSRGR